VARISLKNGKFLSLQAIRVNLTKDLLEMKKILLFPFYWFKLIGPLVSGAFNKQDYDQVMDGLGWKMKIGGFFSFWIFALICVGIATLVGEL
jgi:hypothetical protein